VYDKIFVVINTETGEEMSASEILDNEVDGECICLGESGGGGYFVVNEQGSLSIISRHDQIFAVIDTDKYVVKWQ
jgi:hypothetical protein